MGKHSPLAFVNNIKTRLTIGIAVLSLAMAAFYTAPLPASAACAAPTTNIGTASVTVTVPSAGAYVIWSRIQAPNTTANSYSLEIDGGSCYVVGDSAIPANTWTWVNYQNGSVSSKISATLSAGNHTLKLIGREASVKVDRIMAVADTNCTPTGLGDNCATKSDTVVPKVTLTTPAANATVTGSVAIAATATDDVGVGKVEFYANNQLLSTDTTSPYSYTWDTSTSVSGAYNIVAKAYDSAGNTASSTHAVTLKNGTADTQAPSVPQSLKATA
ncbi:MAG TPA: Ig-like domain-containing protein, partial [Candidatus Saccharimonadales bacterium]|nr:Ig-like domain-containing protein [Candidatus Saccharimonadales bacterium]